MKNLTILTIFVTIFLVFAVKADDEMYSTKYDDMDVDAILASKRMRDGYIHCFLNTGNCTPAGAEVRKNLPDALETKCTKCSEKQKENAKKIAKFLYEKEQESFKSILAKYDPDGKYQKEIKEYLKQHNGQF